MKCPPPTIFSYAFLLPLFPLSLPSRANVVPLPPFLGTPVSSLTSSRTSTLLLSSVSTPAAVALAGYSPVLLRLTISRTSSRTFLSPSLLFTLSSVCANDLASHSIAALLHVHLGTDDENEGKQAAVKVRAAERTRTEQFRSYCEVRTKAWHARRDEIAQRCMSSSSSSPSSVSRLTVFFPQSSTSSLARTSPTPPRSRSRRSTSPFVSQVLRWRTSCLFVPSPASPD